MRGKRTFQIGVFLAAVAVLTFLGRPLPGGGKVLTHQPVPEFHDWSTRHVVYSNWGYLADVISASSDPRAIFSWRARPASPYHRFPPFPPVPRPRPRPRPVSSTLHRDWSINLGTAGTAPAMYPAKFTFDITQTPSCANDFVVFPIAAKGSATQPNVAAFNNLYSGTTGSTGICNRSVSASDTGTSATVLWSYNVQGISGGGAVPTSPVLSYDYDGNNSGLKVAFVESIAGSPAHFHVLAFKSGDGVLATNLQYVLTPKTISSFTTNAPVVGSGTATDLALGASTSGTDTLSSPFVDYIHDTAYVGNDVGVLYRIKDVFCTTDNSDCASTTKPAPSLDTTWGTSGAVTVCTGELTGPVLDFNTLNVYVGCSDGKLYSVSQTGTIKSITVGDGASKTYGVIVDPPVVDGMNGFVYAVSGSANAGAYGALVQAKIDLSSSVVAQIGAGNQCNIHAPVFNNAYYTSPTTTGALLYVGGTTGVVSQPCSAGSTTTGDIFIYAVTFNGTTGVMTAGAPTSSLNAGGGPGAEWAPLLEFDNTTTSTDWLFVAALQSSQTNMATVNITAGAFGTFTNFVTYGLGPSGMIVDNNSSSAQAASIYFNAQGENAACTNNTVLTDTGGCAIKLTQAGLQ